VWRRLLAVLAWIGVASVLASPLTGPVPSAAADGPLPPDVARTAERLDRLQVAITGNLQELRANELLNYHRIEGGVEACMAAAGKPYRRMPYVSRYEQFTDADLGYGAGRAGILDTVVGGTRRFISNEIGFARLRRAGILDRSAAQWRPEDVETLNGCTGRFEHRLYFDADPPPNTYQLAGMADLDARLDAPEVRAAWTRYAPCMRARLGHDVGDRSDFLFRSRLPGADAPVDGQPPSAAWTAGVAALEAAFAADVACRLPTYIAAMRIAAGHLDAWERDHRTELDTIRAAWRQRVADAARLPR
jgi:hypothetical protein